jgi:hypothetical protein
VYARLGGKAVGDGVRSGPVERSRACSFWEESELNLDAMFIISAL